MADNQEEKADGKVPRDWTKSLLGVLVTLLGAIATLATAYVTFQGLRNKVSDPEQKPASFSQNISNTFRVGLYVSAKQLLDASATPNLSKSE